MYVLYLYLYCNVCTNCGHHYRIWGITSHAPTGPNRAQPAAPRGMHPTDSHAGGEGMETTLDTKGIYPLVMTNIAIENGHL